MTYCFIWIMFSNNVCSSAPRKFDYQFYWYERLFLYNILHSISTKAKSIRQCLLSDWDKKLNHFRLIIAIGCDRNNVWHCDVHKTKKNYVLLQTRMYWSDNEIKQLALSLWFLQVDSLVISLKKAFKAFSTRESHFERKIQVSFLTTFSSVYKSWCWCNISCYTSSFTNSKSAIASYQSRTYLRKKTFREMQLQDLSNAK